MATTNGTSEIEAATNGNGVNGNGANGATVPTTFNIGTIRPANIISEMQDAYLDYAMSVIVARALPDVRDGLKPVHRRILYAMWNDLYLTHDKPHRKSARIVGEVLGKYHPHGDVAVYDAMVRMAQDFSLRYPLIDGQGNFGSIDGDGAAAMRYTEARLAALSDLMLTDIEKETVNWKPTFDNSLEEPVVLPSAFPNLLINGANGIAVGMATNVPPHNLGEVVDALTFMIDHYQKLEEVTPEELMNFIKGPDFPTGGILYRFREDKDEQIDAIAQGYSVGKSRLIIQAKAHFEEMSRGRQRIVITELPYQSNKTAIIERIADLVREEKLMGIADLRDESDRTGMRICIELQRGIDPKSSLADLFKYTPLQQTFGMQMLALVDGMPRLLTLKRMLHLFIQHREEMIRKRSEWELARARERAHILEGLLKALDILDEVIATIRKSQTVDTARKNLIANFAFSEIQAQAILDMQLRRLAALERKKLQEEYDELRKQIKYLEDLLAHPEKILAVIKKELLDLKEKYGDARRTQIVDRTKGALTTTDLLPDQQVWVTVASNGDLRRQSVANLSLTQQRGLGKHAEVTLLSGNTRDFLYVFAKDGRAARISVHEIPQDGSAKNLAELCGFTRRDTVTAALTLPRNATEGFVFMATERGDIKRVSVADFVGDVIEETTVMNVDGKDRLGWAIHTNGNQEVMLVTTEGQSIRFDETEVRSMGLAAGGVGGIKLGRGDKVIYACAVDPKGHMLTITEKGFAKQTEVRDYSSQGRNGGGIVTHKPSAKSGNVVDALMVGADQRHGMLIVLQSKGNPFAVPLSEIPVQGRGVLGKQIVAIEATTKVEAICAVVLPSNGNGDEPPAPKAPEKKPEPPKQAALIKDVKPALTTPISKGMEAVKAQASKLDSAVRPLRDRDLPAEQKLAGQSPTVNRTEVVGSAQASKLDSAVRPLRDRDLPAEQKLAGRSPTVTGGSDSKAPSASGQQPVSAQKQAGRSPTTPASEPTKKVVASEVAIPKTGAQPAARVATPEVKTQAVKPVVTSSSASSKPAPSISSTTPVTTKSSTASSAPAAKTPTQPVVSVAKAQSVKPTTVTSQPSGASSGPSAKASLPQPTSAKSPPPPKPISGASQPSLFGDEKVGSKPAPPVKKLQAVTSVSKKK